MLTLSLEICVVDFLTSHIHVVVLTLKLVKAQSESDGDTWIRDRLCMFGERACEGFIKTFLAQLTK